MAEAAPAIEAPLLAGVLYKQADVIKSWRKRWIVLYPTSITYYESETCGADGAKFFLTFSYITHSSIHSQYPSSPYLYPPVVICPSSPVAPRGQIDLKSAVSVARVTGTGDSDNSEFGLVLFCRTRSWPFRAESKAAREDWMAAFTRALAAVGAPPACTPRVEGWLQRKHGGLFGFKSWQTFWCLVADDALFVFESAALCRRFASCAGNAYARMPLSLLDGVPTEHVPLRDASVRLVDEVDGLPFAIEVEAPERGAVNLVGARVCLVTFFASIRAGDVEILIFDRSFHRVCAFLNPPNSSQIAIRGQHMAPAHCGRHQSRRRASGRH
jgi:hypothetical protein